MENETETSGGVTQFVVGIIFSVLSIVIPAFMWSSGIYPSLSFGIMVGASVRFGTDLLLMTIMTNQNADGLGKFASKHIPLVAGLIAIQFGTLIGAGVWAVLGGPAWALGVVVGILVSYVFGFLSHVIFGSSGGGGGDSEVVVEGEDGESEWRFDVDDL